MYIPIIIQSAVFRMKARKPALRCNAW